MIILEVTEDKFGKIMKAVSEIGKHSECLAAILKTCQKILNMVKEDTEIVKSMMMTICTVLAMACAVAADVLIDYEQNRS